MESKRTLSHMQPCTAPSTYLTQLPALELLSRLPVSVLGISDEGFIVYANEALLTMLGYVDTRRLYARPLTEITAAGSRCTNPRDQIELLRSRAGTVTTWRIPPVTPSKPLSPNHC